MEQTINRESVKDKFLALSDSFRNATGASHSVQTIAAREALSNLEFPTTRTEDWKYTRTTRISNEAWQVIENKLEIDISDFLIPGLDAQTIVFVNGHFSESLSNFTSTPEISIAVNQVIATKNQNFTNIFQALGAAICTASLTVDVTKNIQAEKSLHIIHLVMDELAMAQPTIQVEVGPSAKFHLVESFVVKSDVKSFTNRTMTIHVSENAQMNYDKIQMEGDQNFLLNEDNINIENDGRFTINTITADGGWVRNSLNISLDGQNIETHLNGIYLPRKKQLVDNHTKVDHRKPHCNSNELYKGILNDQSTGVFNGKVYVQPDAQKTNAFQSNANILLSDDAQMNTKPELEIYADDVKCSHGTTTGQMDENALFYLKSRGLGDESARRLLSTAFINDVLNKIEHESVRDYTINELTKRDLLFI